MIALLDGNKTQNGCPICFSLSYRNQPWPEDSESLENKRLGWLRHDKTDAYRTFGKILNLDRSYLGGS